MFVINEFNKRSGAVSLIEIRPDNVLTYCPECNYRFNVDLAEVLQGDTDLLTTRILCRDCTAKAITVLGGDVSKLEDYSYHAKIEMED